MTSSRTTMSIYIAARFMVNPNPHCCDHIFFFLYMFFGEPAVHFSEFFPLLPLTEVSPRPSAIPDGNPSGDSQSAVGWGDAGFEPGTAGQQSSALPLSHHASRPLSHHASHHWATTPPKHWAATPPRVVTPWCIHHQGVKTLGVFTIRESAQIGLQKNPASTKYTK
jgi:hypothetical protein